MTDREPTVLLVEDEKTVADSYELYLGDEYETRHAANGGEALVELESDIDVVLLDRRMPGMSGDEVLEHIHDWGLDCRVVMVTAVDPDIDIIDMPCDQYLTKPVDRTELIETVEQALLMDRYEALVSEYYEVIKKYGTLTSEFPMHELEGEKRFQELEKRIDDLREEIDSTIDQFTDKQMSEIFRDVHQPQ